MAFILLFAGFETTVNLIGNGTYALLTHPGQRDAPAARPSPAGDRGLLETGVEELLRYDGPVELATWRFATEPLTHRRTAHRGRRPGARRPRRRRPGSRTGSPTRTPSISPGATTSTWDTATASTTASAPRSPAWRGRPRSPRC